MIKANKKLLLIIICVTIFGGIELMAIEKPEYKVIKEYKNFEIRKYEPYLIAETEVKDKFEDATNRAFRILFDYISGNNEKQEKIKMTSPVNQRNAEGRGQKIKMTAPVSQEVKMQSDGKYKIAFIVPSKYDMETVPLPKDPRVNIREIPGQTIAAVKYSGNWSEEKYRKHEKQLIDALQSKEIKIIGNPVFARYNPPFWPAFMRRNEILIEIEYPLSEK